MKASKILLLSVLASIVLSACGNSHEKVYAVDRVEDAAAKAAQKAPTAEPIKFEDEGQPKMGIDTTASTTTATDGTAAPATDAATKETAASASAEASAAGSTATDSASANTATATADTTKSDTTKTDTTAQ